MKKLLTVSLVAIMAVSAANADIASTTYVTDRTGDVSFTEGVAKGAIDLTAAVKAIDTKLTTVAGTGTGSVSDQIDQKLEAYTTTNDLNVALAAKQDVANIVKSEADLKDGQTETQYPSISYLDAVQKEIQDNVTADFVDLQQSVTGLASTVSDLSGTVTANKSAADTGIQEAKGAAAQALTDAKAYTDQEIEILEISLGTTSGDLTSLTERVTAAEGEIDAIEASAYATSGVTSEVVAKANSAVQQNEVLTGETNGTISVQGTDVAVKGLGSAAYTDSTKYATADQGTKADSAMQESSLKALSSWSEYSCGTDGVTCSLVSKDGNIAWEKVSY